MCVYACVHTYTHARTRGGPESQGVPGCCPSARTRSGAGTRHSWHTLQKCSNCARVRARSPCVHNACSPCVHYACSSHAPGHAPLPATTHTHTTLTHSRAHSIPNLPHPSYPHARPHAKHAWHTRRPQKAAVVKQKRPLPLPLPLPLSKREAGGYQTLPARAHTHATCACPQKHFVARGRSGLSCTHYSPAHTTLLHTLFSTYCAPHTILHMLSLTCCPPTCCPPTYCPPAFCPIPTWSRM